MRTAPWQSHPGLGQPNGLSAYVSVPTRDPYGTMTAPPPSYDPLPLNLAGVATQRPPPPPPPPPPAVLSSPVPASEPRKKVEWPQAVRDYVNRCFAAESQIPGIPKAEMEKRLREVITNAAQSNMLNAYNWDAMMLPQQMIAEDRRQATLGLPTFTSPTLLPPPPPPPLPLSFMPGYPPPVPPAGPETLRKRKSSELTAEVDSNNHIQPPWRSKKGGSLEDRMSAPDKRQKLETGPTSSKSSANLEQRRRRFEEGRSGSNSPRKHGQSPAPAEPLGPVVGRSQKLEKNYFRLTSAPNPDDVRPLPVLKQTLELLKQKWRQDNNYGWACDQFKSLRQDLTVQHIKNEFTTSVYEIHARIALEKGDLGEYNQCQSQLRELYKQNLGGHPTEFKAYRVLYYIYTNNKTDMNDVLSELTPADKQAPAIKHALAVRSALALGNYHQFFKLYLDPPNMGAYLMDMFIERERLAALAYVNKAYKPAVRLRFITEELAFESDEEAAQFVLDHGGKDLLDEKDDYVRLLTGSRVFEDAKTAAFASVDIKGQI